MRPVGVFAPPLPPSAESRAPLVESKLGDTYEIVQKRLERVPNGPAAGEVEVLQTSRRWRGVDVYVVPTANTGAGDFWVRVYAVDEFGGKSLVASGFAAASLERIQGAVSIAEQAAAVRGIASRWLVTLQTVSLAPSVLAAGVQVVAVASDEAVPPPADVGARSLFCDGTLLGGELARVIPFGIQNFGYTPEVISVAASNNLPAGVPGNERWMQIHEAVAPAACVGAVPLWSWPLQPVSAPDGTMAGRPIGRFGRRAGNAGCIAYVSTSPAVGASAGAGDVTFTVKFR